MNKENSPCPLFRVTTFGRFVLERLASASCEQPPYYEPIAEEVWRSRSAACDLFKLLLCRIQRRAPKDLLIEALWPDTEMMNASHSFDSAISRLRSILTPMGKKSILITSRLGSTTFYELPPQHVLWTDIDAFLALLLQADQAVNQGHDPISFLEAAWHSATGDFLEDNLYSSWAQTRRQTINASRHRVLHQLVNLYIQRGRMDQAESLLLASLEEEPTNEDSVCHLMTLLGQQGRRQEALQCYEHLAMVLKEEGEIEPLVSTQALARHLRTTSLVLSSLSPLELEVDIHVTATPHGILESPLFTATIPLTTKKRDQQLLLPSNKQENGNCSSGRYVSSLVVEQQGLSSDMLLYHIIKEICRWTGREGFQSTLQVIIDRLIKEFDMIEQHIPTEGVLSRRDALMMIAGLPLAFLTKVQIGPITTVLLEEFLAQCTASLATCWHLLKGTEFQQVETLLSQYVPELEKLAYQPSKYQKNIASLAAQGHLLSGLLAMHQNNLLAREAHCKQAVRLGQLAEDVNLHMTALKWLAVTYYYAQSPSKALHTYQEIEPFLDQISPLLRGSVYIKMADAYAQCGQDQHALRCIQMAHESFPEHPEDDPCFPYADCGHLSLPLWEGFTYFDLGQPENAWNAFERVERLHTMTSIPERVRVEIVNHQAEVAIVLGDLERFHAYIDMGVNGARALGSEKRYNEAREIYRQAKLIWSKEPRIRELQDLFIR